MFSNLWVWEARLGDTPTRLFAIGANACHFAVGATLTD